MSAGVILESDLLREEKQPNQLSSTILLSRSKGETL